MSKYADLEWVFIDGSHVRAHQHATGIKNQAISRSIGGNSSKIHLAVDSNGNPIQFLIHDGTTHDVKVAPALIDCIDLKDTGSSPKILVERYRNRGKRLGLRFNLIARIYNIELSKK